MRRVGIFEGKAHFSALIHEAKNGETILVTKNGEAVAQIGPVQSGTKSGAKDAMRRILSSKAKLGSVSMRELIEEGRRY